MVYYVKCYWEIKLDKDRNNIGFGNMRWLVILIRVVLVERWGEK